MKNAQQPEFISSNLGKMKKCKYEGDIAKRLQNYIYLHLKPLLFYNYSY